MIILAWVIFVAVLALIFFGVLCLLFKTPEEALFAIIIVAVPVAFIWSAIYLEKHNWGAEVSERESEVAERRSK